MTRDLGTINLSVPNIVLSRIKNKESHILLENLNRKKKKKTMGRGGETYYIKYRYMIGVLENWDD